MPNRTRKELKTIQDFYKEAGLENQIIPSFIDERKSNDSSTISKDRNIAIKGSKAGEESLPALKKNENKSEIPLALSVFRKLDKEEEQKIEDNEHVPAKKIKLLFKQTVRGSQINKIKGQRSVEGCIGHSTVVFKRPFIEGTYYLEFKILPSAFSDQKNLLKYKPSYRIGICSHDYLINTPLGQKTSIGFKLQDAQIVSDSKVVGKYDRPADNGDIIGMAVHFSPPYKYQTQKQLWTGSYITIYKNGQKICQYDKIYQKFYCPAFSLYNYGSLEVRINEQEFQFMPDNHKPYSQVFGQKIPYQNLRNEQVFHEFFFKKNG